MRKIVYILLILTLYNCKVESKKTDKEININKSTNILSLSTYFKDNTPIVLSDKVHIGTIDKVVIDNNNVVVSDFYLMKSLKIFDLHGNLKQSRDDIGEGPMGMSEITDFEIYNNKIFVLDAHKRRIYLFDMNLEFQSEFIIPIACNNFLINDRGIFLLKQGLDTDGARITRYDHQMNFIEVILSDEEARTPIVVSNTSIFTKIDNSSFVFSHPFFSKIWYYNEDVMEAVNLNFGNNYINNEELMKMEPLDRLKFTNDFEGYYHISNGIKLNNNELLFSIRHRKKNKYLKLNLYTRSMELLDKISNDLAKTPSTIDFSGNSRSSAWYWMDQADLLKFYSLNGHKIPERDRIQLDQDQENKVIFNLVYR